MGVSPVLFAVVGLLSQYFEPRFNVKMQLLVFQIRMLRARINAMKIVPTPKERAELMRLGAILDHDINGIMFVVHPSTYKKWIRDGRRGKNWVMPGRKGTPEVIRRLLCIMTESNPRWGHRRIVGELRKLGIRIGATTVRDLLKAMGLYPEPTKGRSKGSIPWRTFIEANKESMLATDFFSKNVWTILGKRQLYFLAFIHIGSRRVYCSVGTYNPDDEWVTQQSRNALMWTEAHDISVKYLIQDRDRKFSGEKFIRFWKGTARRIKTPVRSPMANSFMESWVGSIKRECLNYIVGLSREQINYCVYLWVSHYNTRRPHRGKGIDNNVLDVDFTPQRKGEIQCEQKLGGLITEWSRKEAA